MVRDEGIEQTDWRDVESRLAFLTMPRKFWEKVDERLAQGEEVGLDRLMSGVLVDWVAICAVVDCLDETIRTSIVSNTEEVGRRLREEMGMFEEGD